MNQRQVETLKAIEAYFAAHPHRQQQTVSALWLATPDSSVPSDFTRDILILSNQGALKITGDPMGDSDLVVLRPSKSPMQQEHNEAQQAALYGPLGRGDYKPGDRIMFCSRDTQGHELTGEVLYVRAAAPAIQGGRVLPACYIAYVDGECFIRVVHFCDVVTRT